jgi:hypothetical protein
LSVSEEQCLDLQARLLALRHSHEHDEDVEDALLEETDAVWWSLTREEREDVERPSTGEA